MKLSQSASLEERFLWLLATLQLLAMNILLGQLKLFSTPASENPPHLPAPSNG